MNINKGDVILFPGKGWVFEILSRILWLFNRWWDRKSWHTGIAWEAHDSGWLVLEAVKNGVQINFKPYQLLTVCKIYTWLDKEPSKARINEFKNLHLGKPYDCDGYLGTGITYLIWRLFGKAMRIHDDEYFCWEIALKFLRFMGKPLLPISRPVTITGIIKALQE